MKKIYGILSQYWKQEVHKPSFFVLFAFTAILVALEYTFHIRKQWLQPFYFTSFGHYWRSFCFFGIPFFAALGLLKAVNPKSYQWSPGLVLLVIVALSAFMLRSSFREHHILSNWLNLGESTYSIRMLNYIFLGPVMCTLPVLWWWVYDRKQERLYGCTLRGFDPRAYLVLLLLMIPLITIASTQGDFLNYYPKSIKAVDPQEEGAWLKIFLLEWFYGIDFIYIEFFFRGFMIMAFSRFLGVNAILVTAVFYCTIHFGKPLGETISSFFGGMLLGTLAYKTRSIAGGIMVHMGIAWLMDLGGFIGRLLLEK